MLKYLSPPSRTTAQPHLHSQADRRVRILQYIEDEDIPKPAPVAIMKIVSIQLIQASQ